MMELLEWLKNLVTQLSPQQQLQFMAMLAFLALLASTFGRSLLSLLRPGGGSPQGKT
jgi:hypothetical protein